MLFSIDGPSVLDIAEPETRGRPGVFPKRPGRSRNVCDDLFPLKGMGCNDFTKHIDRLDVLRVCERASVYCSVEFTY